jgi:polar amino acid transport system substrate-binding protein
VTPGKLTICTDFPNPPQEFYNTSGTPEGSDVDTGAAIAARLGLKPVFINTVFDTILEALAAGKCDLVINGLFITPVREKLVDFVPYLTAGQQLLVEAGNPDHISSTDYHTLCGKEVSTELGASEATTAQQWSSRCKAAGRPPIEISIPTKEDVALEELVTHRAQAYFNDSPVVQYYANQRSGQFALVNPPIKSVLEGIAVAKNQPALLAGVQKALAEVESSGAYKAILAKWGLQATTVPPIG